MSVEQQDLTNMTQDLFTTNINAVNERWPEIAKKIEKLEGDIDVYITEDTPEPTVVINGLHITSCYNRFKEAELLANLIPNDCLSAHVYGVGLADVIQQLLLRKNLKYLYVHILSPIVFNVYLMLCDDALNWLNDPRVKLDFAFDDEIKVPYTISTGELAFAENQSEKIRNKLLIKQNESNDSFFHEQLCDRYSKNIQLNLSYLGDDPFIEQLCDAFNEHDFISVAGGPTASKQFDFIKQNRNKYKVICVNSSLMALEKQGIIPDFVIAIEQSDKIKPHFDIVHKDKYLHVPLVYVPSTCPDVVKNWPGIRLVAVTSSKHDSYYQLIFPESVLFSGGSVAHSAVSLALKFGAKSITLVGYDFCYPGINTHLNGNPLNKKINKIAEHITLNALGQKVPTEVNFMSYQDAMEELIAKTKSVKFINTGKEGVNIKGAKWIKE